jgi:hypothetical protein
LGRKRGAKAKLGLLKAMVNECDTFGAYPLSVYFLEEKWKQEFLTAKYDDCHDCVSSKPTHTIATLEEMPFWKERRSRKKEIEAGQRNKVVELPDDTDENNCTKVAHDNPLPKTQLCCMSCGLTTSPKDEPVVCQSCSASFHEFCLEQELEKQGASNKQVKWYVRSM